MISQTSLKTLWFARICCGEGKQQIYIDQPFVNFIYPDDSEFIERISRLMASRTRKQFGQHWLKSPEILRQIVVAARLSKEDRILEIGPGQGVLTEELLKPTQKVLSVEIDRDLCQLLRKRFQGHPRFVLQEADFLSLRFPEEIDPTFGEPPPNKVVANIPYNITGPILERLLGKIAAPRPDSFDSIVLLVQKEVAQRICAKPGSKAFGALSLRVQYLAQAEIICPVPAKAFQPPPKVESAVIRLTPRPLEKPAQNPKYLATLIKLGFATKRKMLRNNLKPVVDREVLGAILTNLGSFPEARGEALSLRQWITLSDKLGDLKAAEEAMPSPATTSPI